MGYMQAVFRETSTLPSVSWDFSVLLHSSQQLFQPFFVSVAEFLTGMFCASMHQGTSEVPHAPLSMCGMMSYLQCCTAGFCMLGGPLSLEINAANGNQLEMGLQDVPAHYLCV